jgi:hypothetical protein
LLTQLSSDCRRDSSVDVQLKRDPLGATVKAMAIHAAFSWNGLTLSHRTVLTGSELAPEYALVRVRRALEDHHGDASGRPSDGHMEFDEGVSSISLTGAMLPAMVSGEVRAERVADGIAVVATASLVPLVFGFITSLIGMGAFFYYRGYYVFPGYWIWLLLLSLAAGWHLRQTARALRFVTTAGTTL